MKNNGVRTFDPGWRFNIPAFERCMKAKNLKPYELQELAGVDHAVIYRLLQGKIINPMSATLLCLAAALQVDPRQLMVPRW